MTPNAGIVFIIMLTIVVSYSYASIDQPVYVVVSVAVGLAACVYISRRADKEKRNE